MQSGDGGLERDDELAKEARVFERGAKEALAVEQRPESLDGREHCLVRRVKCEWLRGRRWCCTATGSSTGTGTPELCELSDESLEMGVGEKLLRSGAACNADEARTVRSAGPRVRSELN